MSALIAGIVWTGATMVSLCCLMLFIECVVAVIVTPESNLFRRTSPAGDAMDGGSHGGEGNSGPTTAVLIPAHNEQQIVGETIRAAIRQLTDDDRLVVVADNCSDETASAARAAGAHVIERQNAEQRGKGFAVAFGVDYLTKAPPDVLVLMDADTHPEPGAIGTVSRLARSSGRPIQAVYLLVPPADPGPRDLVSSLAFLVKNLVRPLGLSRLGAGVPVTGSGVALPWSTASSASLGSGNLVEDMQLGIDLAIAGHPVMPCVEARFTGTLPATRAAARTQRTRWEHGHLQTLLTQTPRLVWNGAVRGDMGLIAMAIDLTIPPLSLLCLGWAGLMAIAIVHGITTTDWIPFMLLAVSGILLSAAVGAAWARYARHVLPIRSLLSVPAYVLTKIPLYFTFLFRRQKEWIRTDRS